MSGERQTRRRAVKLRSDALVLLTQRLSEAWAQNPGHGKLTREEKARLLGVSLGTSERILKNKGVDRPSLTIAFKSLGLKWDDAYCEFPATESSLPVSETPLVPTSTPEAKKKNSLWKFALAAVVASAILIPLNNDGGTDWRNQFNRKMYLAEEAYNTAKYEVALQEISVAIKLAQENENAPCLAGALRVAGDLALASGDLTKARSDYRSAITIRTGLNQQNNLPPIWESLGIVETKLGLYEEAFRNLSLCLEGFTKANEPVGVAMANRTLGTLAHEQKKLDEAAKYFGKALVALGDLEKPDLITDIKARNALILRDRKRYQEAKSALDSCLSYWSQEEHPRWIATTRMQLATVHLVAGDHATAAPLLQQSRKQYLGLGDRAGARECDLWLSRVKPGQMIAKLASKTKL